MTGTTNLADVMLVISVGLLLFLTMSWNMQDIVFSNMASQEKKDTINSISKISEIEQGNQINKTPDSNNSIGTGYQEMGKVYKDPKIGKVIMVEN